MGGPPTKIVVDAGIFVPSWRKKQLKEEADEKDKKLRLADARARSRVEGVERTVQQQTQDITRQDEIEARQRAVGLREGQTFISNRGRDIGGPVTFAGKVITGALEIPRKLPFPQIVHRLGIGPQEFKDEVQRQQELIREREEQPTNPFLWFMTQIEKEIIAPAIAGDITRGEFPQVGINLPGEKADFHIGLYELGTELTDPLLFLGPGRIAIEKLAIPVAKVIFKKGVKTVVFTGETALTIGQKMRTGTVKFNSAIGQYVETTTLARAEAQRGAIGVPKFKNLFGKTPADNWVEQSSGKLVADDIPRFDPTEELTFVQKKKILEERKIFLTDDDRIVPQQITGEPGEIQKLLRQLDEDLGLETAAERVMASEAQTVRYMKTAFGNDRAASWNKLFRTGEDITRTVDTKNNTTYSRTIRLGLKVPLVGDIVSGFGLVAERFPRTLHKVAFEYAGFLDTGNWEIGRVGNFLHEKYDDVLRTTDFAIIEPLRADGSLGRARSGFEVIDKNVANKIYTAEQGHAMKLAALFQEPNLFRLPGETTLEGAPTVGANLIKDVQNILSDNLISEFITGATRLDITDINFIKNYLPQIWRFERSLLDDQGALTTAGYEKIFGSKRFFEKSKQWPSVLDAVIQMDKQGLSIQLADEINNPLDLLVIRLAGGIRLMSDKILSDALKPLAKTIPPDDLRAFRSILAGGSGELAGKPAAAVHAATLLTTAPLTRRTVLSLDYAVLMVQLTASNSYLFSNPIQALKMWGSTLRWAASPEGFKKMTTLDLDGTWGRARAAGLKLGDEGLQGELGGTWSEKLPTLRKQKIMGTTIWRPGLTISHKLPTGINKIPGINFGGKQFYNPLRLLVESQFSRVLAVHKKAAFLMESDMLWGDSVVSKANRALNLRIPTPRVAFNGAKKLARGKGITFKQVRSQFEADLEAARIVNERYGGLGNVTALQGKALREALTAPILTPDFLQGMAATTLRPWITPATPAATAHRGFWIRLLMVQASAGFLLEKAGLLEEDLNVWNPSAPNWYLWKFADDIFNPLGRWRGPLKVLTSFADDVNNAFNGEIPRDMGNKIDWKSLNSVRQLELFISGRMSLPAGVIQRLRSQKDFDGRPFWPEDMEPGFADYASQALLRGAVFLSLQQYLEDRRRNELTKLGYLKYVTGAALYPVDDEFDNGKTALIEAVAEEIFEATGKRIGGQQARDMARIAVTEKNPSFGNRIRPDKISDPFRPTELLDLNMDRVYASMAVHLDWWIDRGEDAAGEIIRMPDLERARLLGRSDEMTPKEKKKFLQDQKTHAIEQFNNVVEDRLFQTDAVEKQYETKEAYPTIGSALQQIGKLMSIYGARNRSVKNIYGVTLDMLTDKRITPTQKDIAIDIIRMALDDTVNTDGTIDHWNRIRMLDELELKFADTPIMDEFFEHEDFTNEGWLLKTWRAASASASAYYEVPSKILTEPEFRLWREVSTVEGDKREEVRWRDEFGVSLWKEAKILDQLIIIERRRLLQAEDHKVPAPADIVAQEVALWLLDGRIPRNISTRKLFKYHTGVEFPSRTDFVSAVDTDLLLSILETGEQGQTSVAPIVEPQRTPQPLNPVPGGQ